MFQGLTVDQMIDGFLVYKRKSRKLCLCEMILIVEKGILLVINECMDHHFGQQGSPKTHESNLQLK